MKINVNIKAGKPVPIAIRSEFVRLDAFLKLANAVESGGQAKLEIQGLRVRVNGEVCEQRGKKLRPGDRVRYRGEGYEVVAEENQDCGHASL